MNIAYKINDKWTVINGLNSNNETGGGDRILDHENQDSTQASFTETAIYSEIKYSGIKNLQLAASGRWTIHSVYDNQFTPSVQSKYDFSDKWSLKASYAQGYRSPSLKELYIEFIDINHNIVGNPDLKPEISYDLQSTVSYLPTKQIDVSLNIYKTTIKNRIDLIETETLKYEYANIDSYDLYGYQVSFAYSIKKLQAQSSAGLSYWSTNISDDTAPSYGKVFDLNNSLTYQLPKIDAGLTINHRLIGSEPFYKLQDNEVIVKTIEAYNMIDLSLQKSFFNNKIRLVSGVKNVLNVKSANSSGGNVGGVHASGASKPVSVGRSWFLRVGVSI